MILSMNQLADFFKKFEAKSRENQQIINIKHVYIWNGTESKQPGPLYIITASDLNNITAFDYQNDIVFIVHENVPLDKKFKSNPNIHIVGIPGKYSFSEIINTANLIFIHANSTLELYDDLLSTISRPDNFQQVAFKISRLIHCPVALISETRHVLSSCEYDISRSEWDAYLKNRLMKMTRIPKNTDSENYYIAPLNTPVGDNVFEVIFPIVSDDNMQQTNGMIYFLCSDAVTTATYGHLLSFLARTMSWFFTRYANKDNALKLQNQRMNFLLNDLLRGIMPSDEAFNKALTELNFNTNRELVLICIKTSASNGTDDFESSRKMFFDFFEDSFAFTFSADIFILTPTVWLNNTNESKNIQKKFTEALSSAGCYAGISSIFHSIDKFFIHYYSRALAASNIAMQLQEDRRWTDFRAVSLLSVLNDANTNITHLCDPALIRLVEHDKAHDSDYLYTLCCYWQLNRDIGRICSFLHIHKNTLYYRLRKISGILQQDINDYDNYIQLSLSISILERLGFIARYRIFDEERRQKKWKLFSEYQNE